MENKLIYKTIYINITVRGSMSDLVEKKTCCVCGTELTVPTPAKDKNGNFYCFDHYKEMFFNEEKQVSEKTQTLLKD